VKIRILSLAAVALALAAVAAAGTPAAAAPAAAAPARHAAAAATITHQPGSAGRLTTATDPQCLWFFDLYQQGSVVVADVESPCGDQVNLVLYRDGVIVRDLCCAVAISTSYPCASSAPVTWATSTGLSLVTNCVSAVVPNVVGRGEVQAINALVAAGLGSPIRHSMFTCDFSTATVISQNPDGGAVVPTGTVVTLLIARFPPRGCS
jgi:hypothetical protein